ncbi:MAG: DUF5103 domain-containing protein [Sphingobacteriales bacterium]|nr:DUF5103 domain-containing protein [Sphingobacteriales bacterium]
MIHKIAMRWLKMRWIGCCLLLLSGGIMIKTFSLQAQQDFDTSERNYSSTIQSVWLHGENDYFAFPAIALGSEDGVWLSFDDLSETPHRYTYTFYHCDAQWNRSALQTFDYLEGFTEGEIRQFSYSFRTFPKYIHYEAHLPDEGMQLKYSGNYVLFVYDNYHLDQPILTRRFVVYESAVAVQNVRINTAISRHFPLRPEVRFSVAFPNDLLPFDPTLNTRVCMLQNGRWDNAQYNLQPNFVTRNTMDFWLNEASLFGGGKEFRYLDTRMIPPPRGELAAAADTVHLLLPNDSIDYRKAYSYYEDLDGKFVTGRLFENLSFEDAQYWRVHFKLFAPEVADGNVYVSGAFSNWSLTSPYQMQYNTREMCYNATLWLKQGLYNYRYVLCNSDNTDCKDGILEADFYEQGFVYQILVYYRARGDWADRLLACYQWGE